MLRGRSLHVGVNTFADVGYPTKPGPLRAAEDDARAMQLLATRAGLEASSLLGPDASRDAVGEAIAAASRELRAGDLFVLTFSGHGGRYPDVMGDDPTPRPAGAENRWIDENGDGHDEAWCLWDGVLLDDRLFELLAGFEHGVRVFVVSDSCFSGTMLRRVIAQRADGVVGDPRAAAVMPEVRASVLLLAACEEHQTTPTNATHGLFTQALLDVWRDGAFARSHGDLFRALKQRRDKTTEFRVGPRDLAFEAGRPFTIAPVARFTPPLKVHVCWFTAPGVDPRCLELAREIFTFLQRPVADDGTLDDPVQRPGLEIPTEVGRGLGDLLDALERPAYDPRAEPPVDARLIVVILDAGAYNDSGNRALFKRAVQRWGSPEAAQRPERLLPIVIGKSWLGDLGGVTEMVAGMVVNPSSPGHRWTVPADVGIVAGRLLLRSLGDADPPRPRVFISHTKADGASYAEAIAAHMRKSTRVAVWYDETDVDRGDELVAQLEKAVGHGVVLVVRTDRYSDSPWCGLELLRAKQRRVPMLTLLAGTDGERAPSPYGGNHQTMVWRADRVDEVVGHCVQAWLHGHHFTARARAALAHAGLPATAEILPRRPELLDVVRRSGDGGTRRLIVYPDPPMAEPESALLRSARPDLRIVTPSTMLGRASLAADPTPPLAGCTVAMSLSTAEDAAPLGAVRGGGDGLTGAHLEGVLYTIVMTTLHAGAQIAYGGDFRSSAKGGYAARLSELHRARRRLGTGANSQLLAFVPATGVRDGDAEVEYWPVAVEAWPAPGVDPEVTATFWSMAMRHAMTMRSRARVVLGGQATPMLRDGEPGYRGPWPGVLEECWRMVAADKGLFVVGGLGGFARVLGRMLLTGEIPDAFRRATYAGTRVEGLGQRVDQARRSLREASPRVVGDQELLASEARLLGGDAMAEGLLARWQRFCEGESAAWPNGLSVDDNRRLMRSTDPTEIAHLIFAGLRRLMPPQPAQLDVALYHGDIASALDVDGYAVTTTPGLQHVGALLALDRQMSGRLGREVVKHADSVVSIPVDTDGLAGRRVLVARLPMPGAGAALRVAEVERLAAAVARAAATDKLESLAIAPFGTTMGLGVVEAVEAMLRGLESVRPSHLQTVVVCEVDRERHVALREGLAGRAGLRELRAGPGLEATASSVVIHADARVDGAEVIVRTTVYDGGSRGPVVKLGEKVIGAEAWAALHLRPARFGAADAVSARLRSGVLGDELVASLRASAGRRLVLVANDLASSMPWEYLAFESDRIPALAAGIARRVAMGGDARPPVDRASSDARLRLLLVVNPRGDLPGAEEERLAVQAALRDRPDVEVDLLPGKAATVAALASRLAEGSYDVVHYAGHARFVPNRPGESGLLLADGTLAGPQLGGDPHGPSRAPRLVVLGGCETARLRDDRGAVVQVPGAEQPFAEALMRAGVAALVGTFYPVGDRAARQFAASLYQGLAAGSPIGEAVVAARRSLYADQAADWGNFLLYGDDELIL